MIKIVIVDDHALIREGLNRILSFEDDLEIVAEAKNGYEAIEILNSVHTDIVLLDINMDKLDGIETLKIIRDKFSDIKIIMLTVEKQRRKIFETLDLGADGYVLKESAGIEITNAIRTVYNGGKHIDQSLINMFILDKESIVSRNKIESLNTRELKILVEISNGLKNKEIGEKLYLSEKTIKNYVTGIFRKIGVEDRVQATIFAINNDVKQYYKLIENKD